MGARRIQLILISCLLIAATEVGATSDGWGLTLLTDALNEHDTQVTLASFPGYTDGLDSEVFSPPDYSQPLSIIRVRHTQGSNDWNAGTGWYSGDMRAPVPVGGSTVFADVFVWATPSYAESTIPLLWYWYRGQSDPENWTFTVNLISTPSGISYTGPNSWDLQPTLSKTSPAVLTYLPTFTASDGLQGYQFRFTALHAVPEPGSFAALAGMLAALATAKLRQRRG